MNEHRELDYKMECDLVGGLIANPSDLQQASMITSGADFSDHSLGRIFDHLVVMKGAGTPFSNNFRILFSELRGAGIQVESSDIAQLFDEGVGSANVYKAEKVRERSLQRKLGALAAIVSEQVDSPDADSQKIIELITAKLEQLRQNSGSKIVSLAEATKAVLERLERPEEESEGSSFGINALDQRFGSLRAGEVVVIGGRPGKGKTALALQIAANVADTGKSVLAISLEMSAESLVERCHSQDGNLNLEQARHNFKNADQAQKLRQSEDSWKNRSIFISDQGSLTLAQVKAKAMYCKAKHGLDLLFIDYLQLLRKSNSSQDLRTMVAENSRAIKALAKELNIPIILLAQLNRQADTEEPNLSHLAESSAIEQDADGIILIGTKRDAEENQLSLFIAKNRHGRIGDFPIKFHGNRTLFTSDGFEPAPDSRQEVSTYEFPNAG